MLPVCVTAFIFWIGSVPAGPSSPNVNDKLAHFLAFGALAVACAPVAASVGAALGRPRLHQLVACASYSSVVGGLLEIWQAMLPYRTAEWLDFVADVAGALVACGCVWPLMPKSKR